MKTEETIIDALKTMKRIIDDTPEDKLKAITDTYGDIRRKIDAALSLLSTKEKGEKEWIGFEKRGDLLTSHDIDKVEVLFETGETCMWMDDWPMEIATHFRFITPSKD